MRKPLNFGWYFTNNFSTDYIKHLPTSYQVVDLPHNMVDFSFNYFAQESFNNVGTYSKEIILNEVNKERAYVLTFEGVNNSFTLYVNGNFVNNFSRPYMEEKVDITRFVKEGKNLIVICVSGNEAINAPPFGNTVDFFPFSGIYREVHLDIYEAVDLLAIKIDARMDGGVKLNPTIRNIDNRDYVITYEIFDENNKIYESNSTTFLVPSITPWDLNNPKIYYLRVSVKSTITTYHAFTFGFRNIAFYEHTFLLNKRPLMLVGLNRHETFPYMGGATPAYLQFSDAVKLKELGVNYVRCSHYPPSRHFLDACDFLGLLVINEVPGWQHIGDENWQNCHLENIKTMIERDYNHPSIIAWSIRINESVDHEVYVKGQLLAKELDLYRYTTGTRNFANSILDEDIYSYNDFSHDGVTKGLESKRKITKTKKPYIVSENNGHMFPTKIYDNPLILESHTKRHLAVLNAFFKAKNIVAISPWCMHDYYTHKEFGSGDKICYHGILDIYRFNKPAAYVYEANFTNKPVLYPLFRGDNGDLPESKLYKTLVISNASSLKLYKNDMFIKEFLPRRDLYKYVPSAPFIIDTFIGENFNSSVNFSQKDRKRVAKLLNYAALHNFNRLKLVHKLMFAYLIVKYRLKREHLVELWSLNVAGWGQKGGDYTLVAINASGEEVNRITLSQTDAITYDFKLTKSELVNHTSYDVTTLEITSLGPFRNHYDFSPVNVSVNGPIKLIGPTIQNLHGGAIALYFRSQKETGSATITISLKNIEKSFNVTVK